MREKILELLGRGGIMSKNPYMEPLLIDRMDNNPTRYHYPEREIVDQMVREGLLDELWNITDLGMREWRDIKINSILYEK